MPLTDLSVAVEHISIGLSSYHIVKFCYQLLIQTRLKIVVEYLHAIVQRRDQGKAQ